MPQEPVHFLTLSKEVLMLTTSNSTNRMRIYPSDLLENPAHRVPVTLCLDVSGSMSGEPLAELNKGVGLFFDALRSDPVANASAEVAIVACCWTFRVSIA